MKREPQLRAAVAGPVDQLVMPLHETMRVRESTFLLSCSDRRRHEEKFGLDVSCSELAVFHELTRVPERSRLGLGEIAHDEPVEIRKAALHDRLAVVPAHGRILAVDDEAANDAVEHREREGKLRMIADDLGHPLIAELVRGA